MTKEQIESKIIRILSGEFIIKSDESYLFVKNPSGRTRLIADRLSKENTEGMDESEHMEFLLENGFWSEVHDRDVKTLQDMVEETKIALWYGDNNERTAGRKTLKDVQNKLMEYLGKKHSYDNLLKTHLNGMIRQRYLIQQSVYDECDSRVDIDQEDSYENIDKIMSEVLREKCTDADLREIALSDSWKLLWDAAKANKRGVFPQCGADLTEEQITLISWTEFFENVREHPEFPGEEVLADSDLFDGWCFVQRKKNQGEKDARDISQRMPEHVRGCDEVFVIKRSELNWGKENDNEFLDDDTESFVKKVEQFNDPMARGAKMARSQALREHGQLQHNDLPDIRKEIEMQFARGQKN